MSATSSSAVPHSSPQTLIALKPREGLSRWKSVRAVSAAETSAICITSSCNSCHRVHFSFWNLPFESCTRRAPSAVCMLPLLSTIITRSGKEDTLRASALQSPLGIVAFRLESEDIRSSLLGRSRSPPEQRAELAPLLANDVRGLATGVTPVGSATGTPSAICG